LISIQSQNVQLRFFREKKFFQICIDFKLISLLLDNAPDLNLSVYFFINELYSVFTIVSLLL